MTNSAANKSFSFSLKGRSVTIGDCGVHATLLDLLRERGLPGAKEGCESQVPANGVAAEKTRGILRP